MAGDRPQPPPGDWRPHSGLRRSGAPFSSGAFRWVADQPIKRAGSSEAARWISSPWCTGKRAVGRITPSDRCMVVRRGVIENFLGGPAVTRQPCPPSRRKPQSERDSAQ